ncbi:MAG: CRISPR-associated endonuclease Cas2 [Ignavibacteriae bacterium]|nr:CRISPR-associated endonuclease Cas2 [Ignavibacteriota bacterium]
MNYIITYDISDDKIRLRISNILEDYGVRVQKSVFECWLDNDKSLDQLTNVLEDVLDDNGNIRIYPLCKVCFEKSVGIGKVVKIDGEDGYMIF